MISRTMIFGDAASMGSDAEVERELEELDAEEMARRKEEQDAAEIEALMKKMTRRGNKHLMRF